MTTRDNWNIAAAMHFYAERTLWAEGRLRSLTVADAAAKPVRRIAVGRLAYAGNWDPEPGAWRRFGRVAEASFSTGLEVAAVKAGDLDAGKMPLVHMTGTGAFTLTEEERAKLAAYVKAGGVLFADAAGGDEAFAKSFAELAKAAWPEEALEEVPASDTLFAGKMADAVEVGETELRRSARMKYGYNADKQPPLQGIKRGGRWAVIFSPLDVTSGLLGTNTEGIVGYMPETSEKLARDVVLYAGGKR